MYNHEKIGIIGIFLIVLISPIVASDEETTSPGVTPDSFLWGIDKAVDQLTLLLTFDNKEKARKGLKIAKERLLEVKSMVEEGKLEAAEKAKESHKDNLLKVQQSINGIEKDNSTEEIEEVIEIEKELEKHEEEVEEISDNLKIKIEIKGTLNEEQKAMVKSILSAIENKTGEVKVEIKSKKDKIKIEIKAETGKSNNEIEDEIEDIEEEKGLADIKKEKALEEIEDAKDDLVELEKELQEHRDEGNVTNETPIKTLMDNAREKISKAEEAFQSNDFGEAFGQANAAEQLIKNAEKILEKAVEKFEEEEHELEKKQKIEVEMENGESKVKIEIGDAKSKFTLGTTDKNAIIQKIAERTGLSVDEVTKLTKFEEEKGKENKEVIEEEIEVE